MRVKVIRPFSTWDATGKVSGSQGEVLDLYVSTALRLINQGFVIDYEQAERRKAKRIAAVDDNDQEK